MMRNKRTRGAVSVFLVLILVPCLLISSVFVDVGRVHLSKSMAESSADLALNSLLTNYDADLMEWYGMAASCQNIEQFYTISASYFLRTLESQGLSDDEIVLLSDYYQQATGDDTVHDLLRVKSTSGASGMITEVKDANLSNATMIKDQVVEFMKYRAPIEITVNIVERLKNESTLKDAEEADKNEELVEDKQEFYEAEGKLTEAAYKSYLAIRKYWKAVQADSFTNSSLEAIYADLDLYKEVYRLAALEATKNLLNTSGMGVYSRATVRVPNYSASDVCSETEEDEDGNISYLIDLETIEDLVGDLSDAIESFNRAKSDFETAAQGPLANPPIGPNDSDSYAVQWWVRLNDAVAGSKTEAVRSAGQALAEAYAKVEAIDECEVQGSANWKGLYDASSLLSTAGSLLNKYLHGGASDPYDTYLNAVNQLESVSGKYYGKINAANLDIKTGDFNKKLPAALTTININLTNYRSKLQDYVDKLNVAIDGDGKKNGTPSLETLKSYATEYATDLKAWSNTANSTDTTMATENQQEISGIQQLDISAEAVDDLQIRLKNIRSQLKDAIKAIDSMKWGTKPIKDLSTVDQFKSQLTKELKAKDVPLTNNALNTAADMAFRELFKPETVPDMKNGSNTDYNVQINPETGDVNTPDLFEYLHDKFKNAVNKESEIDETKAEKESANTKKEDTANNAKTKGRYHGGGGNITKEFSNGNSVSLVDQIKGLIGVMGKLVDGNFTGMRDDLYSTVYVMEMFSYATFDRQGKYELLRDKDPNKLKELDLGNFKEKYKEVEGDSASPADGTWSSVNPKDNYNKSLTNKLITKENNQAYLAEVEYILKGGTNTENIKGVYTDIYLMRYPLNLVSGFQNFWTMKSDSPTSVLIESIAVAISSATLGVIPVPVTKAVLIPILAVFETAKDLDRLEAGFPVELYKSDEDMWWVSVEKGTSAKGYSAFMDILSGDFKRNNTDQGLFYSDYLTLFVYLGFNGSAEGMYQRTAEVIQANIRKLSGSSGYSMKKARMYFQLKADLQVEPLMLTIPLFQNEEGVSELTKALDWRQYKVDIVRGYT